MNATTTEWVVVARDNSGEYCEIVAEGFETEQAAEDYAAEVYKNLGEEFNVEAATRHDAEQVVTQ